MPRLSRTMINFNAAPVASFCAALVLLAYVSGVACHGRLQFPKARQVLAWERNQFFNPNGGNGAQRGPPGVCGDPFEGLGRVWADAQFNMYNIALPTFAPGSRIRLQVILSANHGGKFGFSICQRTSGLDAACFNQHLTRVDMPGQRWFWMQTGAMTYDQEWQLPAGVSCPNGCVLQWTYIGMQSSVEAGCASSVCGPAYANCRNPVTSGGNGPGCGTNWEVFRNCADIIISGAPAPPTNPPVPPTGPVAPPPPVGPPTSAQCTTNRFTSPGGACGSSTGLCCPNDACCSRFGFCGVTSDHCGAGCQAGFGRCGSGGAPAPPNTLTPPTTSCPRTAAPGGACGPSAGGVCCPSGQCCSQWGWCGVQSTHCGAGCQRSFGQCAAGARAARRATRRQGKTAHAAAAAVANATTENNDPVLQASEATALSTEATPAAMTVAEASTVVDSALTADVVAAGATDSSSPDAAAISATVEDSAVPTADPAAAAAEVATTTDEAATADVATTADEAATANIATTTDKVATADVATTTDEATTDKATTDKATTDEATAAAVP